MLDEPRQFSSETQGTESTNQQIKLPEAFQTHLSSCVMPSSLELLSIYKAETLMGYPIRDTQLGMKRIHERFGNCGHLEQQLKDNTEIIPVTYM